MIPHDIQIKLSLKYQEPLYRQKIRFLELQNPSRSAPASGSEEEGAPRRAERKSIESPYVVLTYRKYG